MTSVHPGLKIIPTCIINLSESEHEMVSTHAFLVDADGPQLFAEVCAFCPNPSGKHTLSWHIQLDSESIPTFLLPEKQRSTFPQWPCLRWRFQNPDRASRVGVEVIGD